MTIKKISTSDISNIAKLLRNLYSELGEEKECIKNVSEQLILELIDNYKTEILKVTESNKIIGFITLTESQAIYCGGKYGSIDELYVEPEYRSKKIGAILIEKAKEVGRDKKWKRIEVTAPADNNSKTLKFYSNKEFVTAGPKLKLKLE
ncbi:hypothetical protein GCM10009122_01930 [Fulvivirga kasyanovii]|uniref:GNAT family N-acetyltransferase n=1 Tax=Fulvivirga kasyanovii TaxID=396812 RepID=A0ABW9RYD7_9BACT|nr:GNAT family N-acetyltransferase [Fulvivirga kasyanovii]MTI28218.1 GNAT family N-acetyltransferase [Fulvivirga kasyanovii]